MPINGVWNNPASRRRNRKQAYRSAAIAEKIAEKQSNKTGELIIAYRCYDCSWFHIGHADEAQKIIRKPSDMASLPVICPRCKNPIDEVRRQAAHMSGSARVYCSPECQKK
jgi:hypothetical protein